MLSYGAIFVVVLTLLMVVVGQEVYRTHLADAEHNLQVAAFLAANSLADPLSGYAREFEEYARHEESEERRRTEARPALPAARGEVTGVPAIQAYEAQRLQEVAIGYAAAVNARVALLDPTGNVVADSVHPAGEMPGQSRQPEVEAALVGRSESARRDDPITGEPTLYTAAAIRQRDVVIGLVQMSRPVAQVTAQVRPLLISLALAGLLALIISSALGLGLGRRLVRPVRVLEQASLAMAGGDLDQRVPVENPDELGALATAFNTMAHEVQRTLLQERQFIANASHELRTPLTNIKLRSEALLGAARRHPEVAERYIIEIDREADRLGRLAATLLDLSRLDGGQPQAPAPEQEDIRPVLSAVFEIMRLRAEHAGLTLQLSLPATLPRVRVRPETLETVIINLLDNATKYTPDGGRVDLIAETVGEQCRIVVADTGSGIPAEDLPRIFERFYRADKARSRGTAGGLGSGAGLGLSIVQELVRESKGSLRVESAPGQGSRFIVEFPIEPQAG